MGDPEASAGRARLPNWEQAFVEEAKLGYYLDDGRRGDPSSKVKLVRDVLGFGDRSALRAALLAHARDNRVVPLADLGHGARYNVVSPMIGPSGYVMGVVTGWIVDRGTTAPRNVTLFPSPRQMR